MAWVLAISVTGWGAAGCGIQPDQPAAAAWGTRAFTGQQDIALAAINRAYSALQTAQTAAAVGERSNAIRSMMDAQKHLEQGGIAAAFPHKREAIEQFNIRLIRSVEHAEMLPMLGALATERNVLLEDIVIPLQKALNQAEQSLLE